ncbi:hypothetical protein E1J53_0014705, partial [Lewinella sp. W8]
MTRSLLFFASTGMRSLSLLVTLILLGLGQASAQTCTAPNQCNPTPDFPNPPAAHSCGDGLVAYSIFTEDFDNGFGIFSEDPVPVGANDLTVSTAGDTPSFGTGPETTAGCDGGSNDGEFIYLEGSFHLAGEVHCMSADIFIGSDCPPPPNTPYTLSFWYHMFGDNIGTLEVFVNGNSEFSLSGQQQTANCEPWRQGSIDVSALEGTTATVQICMSESNGQISTFESDISIDHLELFACVNQEDIDNLPPMFVEELPQSATVDCDAVPEAAVLTATGQVTSITPFIFINEIHYDNAGTDAGEFVEVAGTAGFDLSNCELVLYNGSNGTIYGTEALSGTIDDEGDGFGAVSFAIAGLQNGGPDGVALVCDGELVEFVSYEGTFAGTEGIANGVTSSFDFGTESSSNPVGFSLQRIGTGCAPGDFGGNEPSPESPGMINDGQEFDPDACASDNSVPVTFREVRTDDGECSGDYTLTRTWTATDICGNTNEHVQVLTVEDVTPPMFVEELPGNETLECTDDIPEAPTLTATDDCDKSGINDVIWINEFHYDNASGDVGEFVEVAGVAGTDLSNCMIVLYNGSNGEFYETIDLSGVIDDEEAGFGAVSFFISGIQNGGPDGIALVCEGDVVEFISYEGSFEAVDGPAEELTSEDVGVSEPGSTPVGQSLSLTGTGFNADDFTWTGPDAESPGTLNPGQTITGNITAAFVEVQTNTECPEEYTLTRTWTITDDCGNSDEHVQTITVEDNVAPMAVCVNYSVTLDETGNYTLTEGDLEEIGSGSTDACSNDLSYAADINSFDCSDVAEPVIVTITVTDCAGNSANCTSQITVIDDTTPVLECEEAVTVELGEDGTVVYPNDIALISIMDNCLENLGGPFTVGGPSARTFDCADVGLTFERRMIYNDVNGGGEVVGCDYTVTVVDPTLPVLECEESVTVELDENGEAEMPNDLALISITDDNCPNLDYLSGPFTVGGPDARMFDCEDVGEDITRRLVFNNPNLPGPNREVVGCDYTVVVVDNVQPEALCQDGLVELDEFGEGGIDAEDIDNGSNDACGIESLELDVDEFGCADVGEVTVTLTVTDVNGNENTCTATVTVEDNVAPEALCQDVDVILDAAGNGSTSAGAVDNGSNDACGIASLELDITDFSCDDVGEVDVVLTVTDNNGNENSCDAVVTVIDNIPPVITTTPQTIVLDEDGMATLTVDDIASATDACGVASLTAQLLDGPSLNLEITAGGTVLNFGCEDIGENLILVTATDVNGNVSTAEVIVTVDFIQPLYACVGELNLTLNENCQALLIPSMVLTGTMACMDAFAFDITVMDDDPSNGPIIDGCGSFQYMISAASLGDEPTLGFTGDFAPENWGRTISADENNDQIATIDFGEDEIVFTTTGNPDFFD